MPVSIDCRVEIICNNSNHSPFKINLSRYTNEKISLVESWTKACEFGIFQHAFIYGKVEKRYKNCHNHFE